MTENRLKMKQTLRGVTRLAGWQDHTRQEGKTRQDKKADRRILENRRYRAVSKYILQIICEYSLVKNRTSKKTCPNFVVNFADFVVKLRNVG